MSVIDFDQRPVVNLGLLCAPLPGFPKQLCLTLPGGVEICTSASHLHLSPLDYAKQALAMANGALAPLTPFFRVADVILSIVDCLKAIPDILGPPPKPQKLIVELKKLVEKVKLIIEMMPIFSVPILLLQMLDIVIATINGLAAEVSSIAYLANNIQTAQIAAGDANGLFDIIKCAQTAVSTQLENIEVMFAAINPILGILNLLAQLAQLGDPFPIPPFEGLPHDDLDAIAQLLKDLAQKLQDVRNTIPI
jgi:hypothetical protein